MRDNYVKEKKMKKTLLEILHDEVKPALGCTGPISVAFATAEARRIIGGTPKSIKIIIDMNTYKNSIAVVTPGTPFLGVLEPACVGAFYGNAEKGMEVLKDMISPDEDFIRKFAIVDAYGVNARQGSVVTVDIKFGLLDACDFTFEDKFVFGLRTGGEQQGRQREQQA